MNNNSAKHYLQQPYARIVIPDEEGGYHAEILEFPGCYADGESPDEAYRNLEATAESWIEACLNSGKTIPEPSSSVGFNGNVLLRLPRSIHRRATKMAERDRTSLNQFLLSAVSERVGAQDFYNSLAQQLEGHIMNLMVYYYEKTSVTQPVIDKSVRYRGAKAFETAATLPAPMKLPSAKGDF